MLNLFKISFWIIIICNTFVYGQKKADYLLGFDIGRNTLRDPVQMNNEINVNYLLSYKYFMAKAHAGIALSKNFNNIYKFGLAAGFTTKIEKKLSWHLLLGIAVIPEGENENTLIRGGYRALTSGFYANLFKKKKILFGLDGFLTPYIVNYPGGPHKGGRVSGGIFGSINLLVSYRF